MPEMSAEMSDMMSKMQGGADMQSALDGMDASISEMETLSAHMSEMKDAIPSAFDTAMSNYLDEIDNESSKIEKCFQDTLNEGFSNIYLLTAITSGIALLVLALYRWKKKS